MEIPIYKKTQVLKLIETPIHTVYDFMHQRMILFVLYGLFTNFTLMSHFLQFTRIFTKSEISQVSCDNRIKT